LELPWKKFVETLRTQRSKLRSWRGLRVFCVPFLSALPDMKKRFCKEIRSPHTISAVPPGIVVAPDF
jgi:hypothetical protein